uniref:Uncharacterized protein LOC114325046 isoform X2 n=1 Tax=Diabrotica virgifera virgifera TaxID=50390 RepID=A0A6P7F1M1_DIAVI
MNHNNNMLQLCRLCLVKDEVNIPIFEEQGDIRQIFLKISSCLPVKVSRDDQLPKKICDGCSYKLDMLYEFWNTSANAEKQLLTWLGEAGMTSQMTDGTISAVAQQIKPADAFVKQETIDPPDILKDDDDEDEEDKDYMKQEESSNNVEEPPPKRARRTAAVKAAIALDQNSDDDDDSGEPMTKVEDDTDDSDNDDGPPFVDVPSTSADDQPGPSGVGKDGVEAPSVSIHSSDEEIEDEKGKKDNVQCVMINKKLYAVETNVAMFSDNENDDAEETQETEVMDDESIPPVTITDSCSTSSTISNSEVIETEVFLDGEDDAATDNNMESETGVEAENETIEEADTVVENNIKRESDLTTENDAIEEIEIVENEIRETDVFLNGEDDPVAETDAAADNDTDSETDVTAEIEAIEEADTAVENNIEREGDLTTENDAIEEIETVEHDIRETEVFLNDEDDPLAETDAAADSDMVSETGVQAEIEAIEEADVAVENNIKREGDLTTENDAIEEIETVEHDIRETEVFLNDEDDPLAETDAAADSDMVSETDVQAEIEAIEEADAVVENNIKRETDLTIENDAIEEIETVENEIRETEVFLSDEDDPLAETDAAADSDMVSETGVQVEIEAIEEADAVVENNIKRETDLTIENDAIEEIKNVENEIRETGVFLSDESDAVVETDTAPDDTESEIDVKVEVGATAEDDPLEDNVIEREIISNNSEIEAIAEDDPLQDGHIEKEIISNNSEIEVTAEVDPLENNNIEKEIISNNSEIEAIAEDYPLQDNDIEKEIDLFAKSDAIEETERSVSPIDTAAETNAAMEPDQNEGAATEAADNNKDRDIIRLEDLDGPLENNNVEKEVMSNNSEIEAITEDNPLQHNHIEMEFDVIAETDKIEETERSVSPTYTAAEINAAMETGQIEGAATEAADNNEDTDIICLEDLDDPLENDNIEKEAISNNSEIEAITEDNPLQHNHIEMEIDVIAESDAIEETERSVSPTYTAVEINAAMETDQIEGAATEAADNNEDTDIICLDDSENSEKSEEEEDNDSRLAANNDEDVDNSDDRFVEEVPVFVNQDPEEDPLCDPLVNENPMPENDIITIEDDASDQIMRKSKNDNARTLEKHTRSPEIRNNVKETLPKDYNGGQNKSVVKDSFYEQYSEFVKSMPVSNWPSTHSQKFNRKIRTPRAPKIQRPKPLPPTSPTPQPKKRKPLPPAPSTSEPVYIVPQESNAVNINGDIYVQKPLPQEPPTTDHVYMVPKDSTAVNINGEIYLLVPDTEDNNQIGPNSTHLSSPNITLHHSNPILQSHQINLQNFPSHSIPSDVGRGQPPINFPMHLPLIDIASPNYFSHHTLSPEVARRHSSSHLSHHSVPSDNVRGPPPPYGLPHPEQSVLASRQPPSVPDLVPVTRHNRGYVSADVVPEQYSSLDRLGDYVSNSSISADGYINYKKASTVPINANKRRKKTVVTVVARKNIKGTLDMAELVKYYQKEGTDKSKAKGKRGRMANVPPLGYYHKGVIDKVKTKAKRGMMANITPLEENVQPSTTLEPKLPVITSVMSLQPSADDTDEIVVLPDKSNRPPGSKDDIETALPSYYIDRSRDIDKNRDIDSKRGIIDLS